MKRVLVAGKIIKSAGRRHESQVTVPGASVYSQPRWGYSSVDEFHTFRAQANGACWCGRSEEVTLHLPESEREKINDLARELHGNGVHSECPAYCLTLWDEDGNDRDDALIVSPSGWSFRASQENGDEVDCNSCGNSLDDDYPIVNDGEGFAYHAECLNGTACGNPGPDCTEHNGTCD